MGIEGFERNLSEEGKMALKSETWQKVRDSMKEKKEVEHFTAENTAENAYGAIWNQVVKEYLRSGYNAEDKSPDIVVMGETYKTLRRPEVTVFYDATGGTLFDVANDRLEKEYEWLMNGGTGDAAENMDTREEHDADGKGDLIVEQTEEDSEAGEAPQVEQTEEDDPGAAPDMTEEDAESVQEPPEPVESKGASRQESRPAKQQAEEKLKKELAAAKDKSFADPIIGYLMERCREDEGMAEDVAQEHKTWQKCFDYIYSQARKQVKGNCAAVRDEVVYEWAEDYYHKDDKAEEEKKAPKAAENKVKRERPAAERKTAQAKGNADKTKKASASPKTEAPKEPPKPKKNGKEMDGQLDLFAMMGM
ncbi:PcfK-like family protein [uncultured Acetatifactor sp.]|uniref:PcfK-like family protein n=1 Tax=uncultured Acetatifactor sp. TaxID=1671927 RepID=UPI00261CC4FB|nr:PcfK-like family protein [uncultured Acetatifactor sp.]